MAENAYVFFHPQYGGLRVVNSDEGLFFCLEDLVTFIEVEQGARRNRNNEFDLSQHPFPGTWRCQAHVTSSLAGALSRSLTRTAPAATGKKSQLSRTGFPVARSTAPL